MATLDIKGASKTDLHLVPPEALTIIGLDTQDGKEHPLYDERVKLPVDPAMVKNVAFNGVIENIICKRDGDRLLVVAGRQRTRWAREANKQLEKEGSPLVKVPVTIKRTDEKESFGLMITENENRVDDEILTKAAKCKRFLDLGANEDEAAVAFGVTKTQIKNWLSICDLSTPVKKAIESGRISASAAVQLAPLNSEDQKKKLDELLADAPEGKKVSGSKVSKKLGKKKRKKSGDDDKPSVETLQKIQAHLCKLDQNKKLTGKVEGFFDGISYVLGLLSPDEVYEWYPDAAEAVSPAEPAEPAKK